VDHDTKSFSRLDKDALLDRFADLAIVLMAGGQPDMEEVCDLAAEYSRLLDAEAPVVSPS